MTTTSRDDALGDEEQLRGILEAWERSPEAIEGTDAEATRLRLVRRIAEIEEQLALVANAHATLQESPIWQLKKIGDRRGGSDDPPLRSTCLSVRLKARTPHCSSA